MVARCLTVIVGKHQDHGASHRSAAFPISMVFWEKAIPVRYTVVI